MRKVVLAGVCAVLVACGPIESPDKLYGHYELKSRSLIVTLIVNPNHSYIETIKYSTGSQENTTNTWQWTATGILFHDLLLPEIDGVRADADFGPETAGRVHLRKTDLGTNQMDWTMAGETIFGRTRLTPYSDEDMFFYRIK